MRHREVEAGGPELVLCSGTRSEKLSSDGRFALAAGQADSVTHGVQVMDSEGLIGEGGHDVVTFLGEGKGSRTPFPHHRLVGQWVWARVAL